MNQDQSVIDSSVRFLRFVYIALVAGVSVLALICIFVVVTVPKQSDLSFSPLTLKEFIFRFLFMLFPGAILASVIIPPVIMGQKKWYSFMVRAPRPSNPITKVRVALLCRIMILEMCAMFGIILLLFAGLQGPLASEPVYWCLALPYFYLLWVVFKTYPSKIVFEELMGQHTNVGV